MIYTTNAKTFQHSVCAGSANNDYHCQYKPTGETQKATHFITEALKKAGAIAR